MAIKYCSDFETTTDENDCRVWAWGVCEIGNPEYFVHGNSIDTFFEYMKKSKNATFYFHNLKFDGEFLLVYLFENGYKWVSDRKQEDTKTFTTLISDTGQFYSIKIIFEKKGKKTNAVTIYDSLKILPFSVSQIAKGFNLPISKLEIDYKENREIGHILTQQEIDYLRNDVDIVARALHVLFEQGLDKMTQASNAMYDYKNTVGTKNFERWFPVPDYDSDVRQSYKGGFTYLNPKYKNIDIEDTLVLDVNSLYPWVMHDCPLPYGDGIYFEGEYEEDKLYNLYVQMFTCQFKLKEGYIPTIQLKNNLSFIPTQYLTSSGDEEVTLCLTSVDLELFREHYEIYNPEYHNGWKFKSTVGLFTKYIDKWTAVKIESGKNGNKAMRTLAKLMLNALYGRFALNPKVASKIPYYDNGVVKYDIPKEEYIDDKGKKRKRIKYEYRTPIYIPVGTFITAWARHKTITSAQKVYDKFVYADTDSLHLDVKLPNEIKRMSEDELAELTTEDLRKYGVDIPEDFEIDGYSLGAWKVEEFALRSRYLRQKSYIHDNNPPDTWGTESHNHDLLSITCAGMPEQCYEFVTWENFYEGNSFKGKLQPKHVQGGIVLKDIDFTIKKI